jgi:CHAT domain-containing protein
MSLLDEGIHMAGACQLAGFPSVIGTLWQITDEYSPPIAAEVYQTMLTNGALDFTKAAYGLHRGQLKVREETKSSKGGRRLDDPMAWAPYKHIGV